MTNTGKRVANRPPTASRVTRALAGALGGRRRPEDQVHLDEALRAARANDTLAAVRAHNETIARGDLEELQICLAQHLLREVRLTDLAAPKVAELEARVVASWAIAQGSEVS